MAGFRQRIETQARATSSLQLGLFGLLFLMLGVLHFCNALYGSLPAFPGLDHRGAQRLVLSASTVLVLASGYFFYLTTVKTKLTRRNPDDARE